jgi:hypothetical protein
MRRDYWRKDELAKLCRLYASHGWVEHNGRMLARGEPFEAIAKELGRSVSSCRAKVAELKLSPRDRPWMARRKKALAGLAAPAGKVQP